MADREKEVQTKLLHGMPEDFEPAVISCEAAELIVFSRTLYGGPFHQDRVCPFCGERNAREAGEPCPHCGREGEP